MQLKPIRTGCIDIRERKMVIGQPMKKTMIWILIFFFSSGTVASIVAAYMINRADAALYTRIIARTERINDIPPLLDKLDTLLWGIISVYDPAESRKVDIHEREQYVLLRKMKDCVFDAVEGADTKNVHLQLEMIDRSLESLSKRVDALKSTIALKTLDTQSTAIFFKNSPQITTLTDSYVDEMQHSMERMRFTIKNIRQRIGEYMAAEVAELTRVTHRVEKKQRILLTIDSIGIMCTLALGAIAGMVVMRTKDTKK